MPDPTLKIISRESPLAMWQAEFIKRSLLKIYPGLDVDINGITTEADKFLDRSLDKFGGKGAFTKDLETALLSGVADLAVHSMKDVTVELPDGLVISSILKRTSPGDAFVSNRYAHLDDLPEGGIVGTSSLRRISQLKAYRPDLNIRSIRGNVGTRIKKLDQDEFDALILATAGLERLGMASRINHELSREIMLPAIGQGALGIEIRKDNREKLELITPLNDTDSYTCVMTERRVNKKLNGGCYAPIAAHAVKSGNTIEITAMVGRIDGTKIIKSTVSGPVERALELGDETGDQLIAQGAEAVLSEEL